jgi:hypothetical protein
MEGNFTVGYLFFLVVKNKTSKTINLLKSLPEFVMAYPQWILSSFCLEQVARSGWFPVFPPEVAQKNSDSATRHL